MADNPLFPGVTFMATNRFNLPVLLMPVLALAATVCCSQLAQCEVKTLVLPSDYADFALNPETGTVASISAESSEIVFFRETDLSSETPVPTAKHSVGSTPCSIFYKAFQDKRVFSVVCTQDPHMYIFDAGRADGDNTKEFSLLGKVPLESIGNSLVTGSINPEDPFLYHCYGSGHDSKTGVVSLRDLQSHGAAFDGSMDCAISASGEVAYRRGPWSPSGFESLIRTNTLSETAPKFSRLFYDHRSVEGYVPDPFDRLTAVGPQLYARSLETIEQSLSFMPLAFFRSRPIIVGIPSTEAGAGIGGRRNVNPAPASITIQAASSNNFVLLGNPVKLDLVGVSGDRALARGVESRSDFKRVVKRSRLFADDARLRCIYADGNRLCWFPIAEFAGADEPFLMATLENSEKLHVGRENRLTLKPVDARVQLIIDDKPDGMVVDGESLVWTPSPDQIGTAVIVATLKHELLQKTQRFEVNVTLPGYPLPFQPAGFVLSDSANLVFLWEGDVPDQFRARENSAVVGEGRIAIMELEAGKIQQHRKIADAVNRAAINATNVFLVPALPGAARCEILRIKDLEREKSLMTDGPITHLEIKENLLILQTAATLEIYDVNTFALLKSFRSTGPADSIKLTKYGFYVNGVLYGFDLKAKLLVSLDKIPQLGGPRNLQPPAVVNPPAKESHDNPKRPGQGVSRLATSTTPDGEVTISLDFQSQPLEVPGSIHTWRTAADVSLTTSGAVEAKQVIVRTKQYAQTSRVTSPPAGSLQVNSRQVGAVFERVLFLWPIPARKNADVLPLELRPQQSFLQMTSDGPTELKHELNGGRAPVSFSLLKTTEALSIDEATGIVTINKARAMADAMDTLQGHIRDKNRGESFLHTLREYAAAVPATSTSLLGLTPVDLPVAMPVLVTVNDADLNSATLQYSVIINVPAGEFRDRLVVLDAEREKRMAEMQAERAQREPMKPSGKKDQNASATEKELEEVKRRVASLEDRLDLVTRQLNRLLDELDEKAK